MNERIVNLESKLAFQENTIEELNQVVITQQNQIEQLQKELKFLREEFENLKSMPASMPAQEVPPHF